MLLFKMRPVYPFTRLPSLIHDRKFRVKISLFGSILDILFMCSVLIFCVNLQCVFSFTRRIIKILLVQLIHDDSHHRKFLQNERFLLKYNLPTFDQNA